MLRLSLRLLHHLSLFTTGRHQSTVKQHFSEGNIERNVAEAAKVSQAGSICQVCPETNQSLQNTRDSNRQEDDQECDGSGQM